MKSLALLNQLVPSRGMIFLSPIQNQNIQESPNLIALIKVICPVILKNYNFSVEIFSSLTLLCQAFFILIIFKVISGSVLYNLKVHFIFFAYIYDV